MNTAEQHIVDVGHARWAFPNAQFYWFVGGETDDPVLQSQMRYRIVRDMTILGARCQRLRRTPVVLLTNTQATPLMYKMLSKFPGWKVLLFGDSENALHVPDADLICCKTADVILCYGTPSEHLLTKLDEIDDGPELVKRDIGYTDRAFQPVKTRPTDPYSRFWTDVDRLRHWRPNPSPGLNIRDEIDMRPQFRV